MAAGEFEISYTFQCKQCGAALEIEETYDNTILITLCSCRPIKDRAENKVEKIRETLKTAIDKAVNEIYFD